MDEHTSTTTQLEVSLLSIAIQATANLRHSELTEERYHALSEATMEALLESLEEFVDSSGNSSFEAEYHVRYGYPHQPQSPT